LSAALSKVLIYAPFGEVLWLSHRSLAAPVGLVERDVDHTVEIRWNFPSEARALLDSIDISTHVGLRDRALIGLMVYSFARIGTALGMAVEDVYTQNRRLWVRNR
jgi:integrase